MKKQAWFIVLCVLALATHELASSHLFHRDLIGAVTGGQPAALLMGTALLLSRVWLIVVAPSVSAALIVSWIHRRATRQRDLDDRLQRHVLS